MALREQCEKAGMTLTELARLANMRLTALSKVEHGRRQLTLREGNLLAQILGCNPQALLVPPTLYPSDTMEAPEHG